VEAPNLSSGRAGFEAEKPVFTHEGGAGFMGSGNGLSYEGPVSTFERARSTGKWLDGIYAGRRDEEVKRPVENDPGVVM
jgi:hypothetical protein